MAMVLAPTTSYAEEYKLLEPLPCIEGVSNCTPGQMQKEIDLNSYILYVYKFSIAIAVFLAIVMIIWGGFLTMTSEIPYIKSDGKSKIKNAITGLTLVLVSYLILATIDPRLVNIDSKIEPIKINQKDLDSTRNFQNELASEITGISIESQIKVAEINAEISDLEKQKAEIVAARSRGEDTYEGTINNQINSDQKISQIDDEIKQAKVDRSFYIAEGIGLKNFSNVIQATQKKDTEELKKYIAEPVPDTVGSKPRPTDSPNVIQNEYNTQINEILKTSNTSGDKIQTLEKQKKFFIAQAKEEKEFARFIDSKKTYGDEPVTAPNMGAYQVKVANVDDTYLNKKLDEYKTYLNNSTKANEAGLSQDQYNKIVNARINSINQVMGKTNP